MKHQYSKYLCRVKWENKLVRSERFYLKNRGFIPLRIKMVSESPRPFCAGEAGRLGGKEPGAGVRARARILASFVTPLSLGQSSVEVSLRRMFLLDLVE